MHDEMSFYFYGKITTPSTLIYNMVICYREENYTLNVLTDMCKTFNYIKNIVF